MNESALMKQIMLALGNLDDFRVWRNSTGALRDINNRLVRFGLAPGSADLVGILAPHGRFVALEIKTDRKGSVQSDDQKAWERVVREMGGVYEICRSVDDALEVIAQARECRGCQKPILTLPKERT